MRKASVIQRLVLKKGNIEVVRDTARSDVMGEGGMSLHGRQRPWSAAFISGSVGLSYSERKRGIVIEEE